MSNFDKYSSRSFGFKVNRASRLIGQQISYNFKSHDYDVSLEHWRILLFLWKEDGQTQTSLASSTQKDEPSISRILNTMEKHNLVVRKRHPHDRRTNLIYLTEKGRNLQDGLMSMGSLTNAEATEGLSRDELAKCMKVLDKVADNLANS